MVSPGLHHSLGEGADLKTSGIILTGREALCVHERMFVCKGVRARVRETGKHQMTLRC